MNNYFVKFINPEIEKWYPVRTSKKIIAILLLFFAVYGIIEFIINIL